MKTRILSPSGIDFTKNIEEWPKFEPVNEVNSVIVPVLRHNENKVKCAKQLELENWKQLVFMMKFLIQDKS